MNRILMKKRLSSEVFEMEVEAPLVARERKAGQFVVLQLGDDFNERIPLTIADADTDRGSVTLIFQTVGETTHRLAKLEEGDCIANLLGPLGRPTDVRKYGKVVIVGGGIGIAPAYPIASAMKAAGNDVRVITGARNKDLLIFRDRMRKVDENFITVTDDGSEGLKGVVTLPLEELCSQWKPDLVVAIGPAVMMKFCALTTKKYDVHTLVSLNTIMIDGTGMCGGCRVVVDGKMKFVCVEGPEFDGHLVDWDNLIQRQATFRDFEKEHHHRCHIELQIEEGQA